MAQVTIGIKTSGSVIGDFHIFDRATRELVKSVNNVLQVVIDVPDGLEMLVIVVVTGTDGTKYSISTKGATKAWHPTSEIVLADGQDDVPVLIVG